MSLHEELGPLDLDQRVQRYYDRVIARKLNYYEMLEISKTATSREIETAFRIYSGLFPLEGAAGIHDEGVRRKCEAIVNRLRKAYATLTDYAKRASYEKRGFREEDEVQVQDEPFEKARLLYRKAKTLQQQKDYHTAVRAMKEAIAIEPNNPSYYFQLGLCQAEISTMIQDAEKNLQKAADMEEWNAEPLVALGMLFYKIKLLKRAEGYFRRALALENSHPVARKKLEEIAGPEKNSFFAPLLGLLAPLREVLAKIMPTFFGEKKKRR